MFAKLSLLAVALPFVHALTLNAPTDAVSTQQSTITWTHTDSDQTFSFELNHPSLLERIAIANNVNPGDDSLNVTWPRLLETTGYTLEAVNIGNITDVFATSAPFNIAPPPSTTSSATSTGSGTASGASTTATNPASRSPPASNTVPTVSNTGAGSATGASGSNTANGASSSSPAPSQINGGGNNGAFAVNSNFGVVALVAAAGAALVAL